MHGNKLQYHMQKVNQCYLLYNEYLKRNFLKEKIMCYLNISSKIIIFIYMFACYIYMAIKKLYKK